MNNRQIIFQSFKNFARFNTPKLFLIFVLTILLAFTQGISTLLIIPLLQMLDISSSNTSNEVINIFNTIIQKLHLTPSIETLLFFYVIILSTLFILQKRKSVLQSIYQNKYSGFLRTELYRKVIFSNWKYLNKICKHNHIQILTSEIPKLTQFYFFLLSSSTKLIIIIANLCIAFLISFKMTALVTILGIVQFALLSRYLKKSYNLGVANRTTFKTIFKYIDEFWITIKPAKIHNTEQFYYNNFKKTNDLHVNNQIQQIKNNEKPQLTYKLLGLFNLVFLVYISYKILAIPISSMIVLIFLFNRILPMFMSVYNDINQMYLNAASVINIEKMEFEVLDNPSMSDIQNTQILSDRIEISNIDFAYSEQTQIFTNFSAIINANKITGIFGESGKGKTTLIDLISGLLISDKGDISYDAKILNKENSNSIRKNIGYLPQESLFIDGTIRENLTWDSHYNYSDSEIEEILSQVNALDLLKQKNIALDSKLNNYKYRFSGGELQRLALARVLLRKPQLLILDEATSALDEKNEDIILSLLTEIKKTTTIIFVTHKKRLLTVFDDVIEL